ncbi:hypothetical protein EAW55_08195 [Legionella jordanis]|uniref:hypothetical protein n=1 Tax=Legionella jordanis TaxID=456 RepID=UPI00072FB63B|nr:hypothetical protein [Legionella jordanis]RMX03383.1 hypothetical protein EAW55_08195 [Legionella jordanis]RMX14877.1 hypothetical protein EAS68_13355 [Legionella jordanis]
MFSSIGEYKYSITNFNINDLLINFFIRAFLNGAVLKEMDDYFDKSTHWVQQKTLPACISQVMIEHKTF